MRFMYALLMYGLCSTVWAVSPGVVHSPRVVDSPDVALYYQKDVPVDLLKAFDVVVLDPSKAVPPDAPRRVGHSQWYARLRADALGQIIESPAYFFAHRLASLLSAGYDGVLLDDGSDLNDHSAQLQAQMLQVFAAFQQYAPGVSVIVRNYPDLASHVGSQLRAVVLDGVYAQNGVLLYPQTRAETSIALQGRSVPVVALGYCPVHDLACRRRMARAIHADGFIPYVSDRSQSLVGIGDLEVFPRKVLMVQLDLGGAPLDSSRGVRVYSMPLNQLGYDVEYVDVQHLPSRLTRDRYAGVVVALEANPPNTAAWRRWLLTRVAQGMPVAILGRLGFDLDPASGAVLGLSTVQRIENFQLPVRISKQAPMMGFEMLPAPDIRSLSNLRLTGGGQVLLQVEAAGRQYDEAFVSSWGGYVSDRFTVIALSSLPGDRWVVQPMQFFRQALQLPSIPMPVVTTENGLRLLFVHIDGDGFPSRTEFPGNQLSAEVLRDQILKKYQIPQTVTVIQGEIARDGLYPALSPKLENLAREIFELPNVEIGSHTYSHPFIWEFIKGNKIEVPDLARLDSPPYLDIPGYQFDLKKEIVGSIKYINDNLAPTGKKVEILQWSGDAQPPENAVQMASDAKVLNINGGDTTITTSNNSWTAIAPIGVAKGEGDGAYQVYVGEMNENVFTGDWTGPFYGYRRIVETFDLTDSPIRFKPVNIYYHFYSATKTSSLKALNIAYDDALSRKVLPIYTTEYVKKVLDWRHVAIGRKGDEWKIQSGNYLREIYWPSSKTPRLLGSRGVSGYTRDSRGVYIHMGSSLAEFLMQDQPDQKVPSIDRAAGQVRAFQRHGRNMKFQFGGYYKPYLIFRDVAGCRVSIDGQIRPVGPRFNVSGNVSKPVRLHDIRVICD
ncbi:hypothetical protein ABS755_11525 [Castellaniella sp. FW104-16D08]|uniref:hypothetical protein n=1 Tax=unclassified Castellaniella TaxID=2617606 RepID=UPI003314825C